MPSPFPGMDPYLEAPSIWPDLHEALASEIRAELNTILPPPYYARLEMRSEVGIDDSDGPARRRIVPDVNVARGSEGPSDGGVAILEQAPPAATTYMFTVPTEPIKHPFVEIRDPQQSHKLITLIEIVSPSNKHPGVDRRSYEQKQREVLDSDANLVEIDLHRSGRWLLPNKHLEEELDLLRPQPDYLVLVNRAWQRVGAVMTFQAVPISIRDSLPTIPIPLRQDVPEVMLPLQLVFDRAYEKGPYLRGAVDYARAPRPALLAEDASWAEERLRAKGLIASPSSSQ